MKDEKIYHMKFSKIYPLLVNKAVKKGKTQEDVDSLITWLTGYTAKQIQQCLDSDIEYADFFMKAPHPHPKRFQIKGKICGIDIESIEDVRMKEIRYLDKLIDDMVKNKKKKIYDI